MSNPHPSGRRRATAVAGAAAILAAGALAAAPSSAAYEPSSHAAIGEVLFEDDFSTGAGAWRTSGGSWSVSGAQTYQQSSSSGNARAFAGDSAWRNVTVQTDATPASGSGGSSFTALLGRVQNNDTYYYLTLRNNNQLEINKLVGGSRTVLDEASFPVNHGQTYRLGFELWFDELTGYVDGQPLVSATDDDFVTGEAGLKTFNATAEFDQVLVGELSDQEPPTVPQGLAVTGVTSGSISLSWSPSTDNDQVERYDIYRVGSPNQLVGSTGDTDYTVDGLQLGVGYEFYVVAVDRSGNESTSSQTVSATTAAPAAPSGLQVAGVTATSVELTWQQSPDHSAIEAYDVYRVGSPDQLLGGVTGTTYLATGLAAETSYQFYVVARDGGGVASAPSNTVSATTEQMPEVPPLETPIGYASMNGGTTGGFGAANYAEYVLSEYWPTSGYDEPGEAMYQLLREHRHNQDDGLVIYVDVTISEDDFGRSKMDVTDNFNVSILGVGTQGELDGVGTTVRRSHNIVFRNLTIHHVSQGEGTAIEVTDDSSNIWIDHNEFFSELDNEPDKDYYDGLVDIKRNAEYVTVSWNYFHDHWKTMLLGHNDNANLAPDKVTYHHNWFRNVNTRLPLARFADVHMLNNVFQDVTGSAINARMGAQILVEGNYFLRVGSGEVDTHANQIQGPVGWWYGSNETGYWNLQNNIFEDSPHEHLSSTTDFTVPYDYTPHDPATARDLVQQHAGVGVIEVNP